MFLLKRYGFNAGSALLLPTTHAAEVLPLSGVNTTLAGGTAGVVALFVNLLLLERYTGEAFFDLKFLMNGSLSGLVAITGSCGVVEPWAAVLIGAIAGILYIFGSWALVRMKLDDAVDAIPGESLQLHIDHNRCLVKTAISNVCLLPATIQFI